VAYGRADGVAGREQGVAGDQTENWRLILEAARASGAEVMLLEAKGTAVNPPQQVNYFLGALGELLQRMSDASATYGLVLPDSQQYRGLAARLPALAWQRLRLMVLFISKDDAGQYMVRRVTTPS
jgi:hypothetical protein